MSQLRVSSQAPRFPDRPLSATELRGLLGERLRERVTEIEQAAATRVFAISGPTEAEDPEYVQGLRAATSAALAYGLEAIERGERAGPVPAALLEQARQAARYGIPLDTVLRRYFAGYTMLGDLLFEQAERLGRTSREALREVQRTQATLFERLIAAVSEAYTDEAGAHGASREQHRLGLVRRLLDGELVNAAALGYDLDAGHLGIVVDGPVALLGQIRELARALDSRTAIVSPAPGTHWAWLGGRRLPPVEDLIALLAEVSGGQAAVGVGEPNEHLAGWRLTHRQARAALTVAQRSRRNVTRYADVALSASALGDDLLTASLRQLYLEPLERSRDGGVIAKQTLRAYFAADRNAASAAVALGVTRQGMAKRLRQIEERLGRPLSSAGSALEVSIRLDELQRTG